MSSGPHVTLNDQPDDVASDEQHSALYDLLVGAASEIVTTVDVGSDVAREEEAA